MTINQQVVLNGEDIPAQHSSTSDVDLDIKNTSEANYQMT